MPDQRTLSRIVSTVVPLIVLGLVSYASYTFVKTLCVDYLLRTRKQNGTGNALIAVYFVLFGLFMFAYLRTLITINVNPGYVECGPESSTTAGKGGHGHKRRRENKKKWHTTSKSKARKIEEVNKEGTSAPGTLGDEPIPMGPVRPRSGSKATARSNLREFWTKDQYVCETDGLPRWCAHCNNWKPDRTSHSSDVGRCVRRLDHTCPWVGGVVGETSIKFFTQTVFYGGFYTVYMLVCFAYFTKNQIDYDGNVNNNWLAMLVLSGAFGIFSVGMTGSTIQLMLRNRTTLENMYSKTRVHFIAMQDDRAPYSGWNPDPNFPFKPVREISYPLPANHPLAAEGDAGPDVNNGPPRRFVVARTNPGVNPWVLDSWFDNIAEVMGYNVWEWWLPITRSPVELTHSSRYNERLIEELKQNKSSHGALVQ